MIMKKCRICLRPKPDEEFPEAVRRSKDTSNHVCLACASAKGLLSGLQRGRKSETNKTEKTCPRCGKTKSLTEFRNAAHTSDGKYTYSIVCCREICREQYLKRKARPDA